jgi:Putative beta-barrel porin 2
VLLLLVGLGPAVAAHAQTQPLPPLPPQPLPTPSPSPMPPGKEGVAARPVPPPVPTPVQPSLWDYEIGVGALWQQNVEFVPDGTSDWQFVPRLRLSRRVWRPLAETRITADVAGFVYQQQKNLNRADGSVGLDGNYQLSRHVKWRIGGGYTYGHADTSSVLTDQGVLLPLTRADTITGSTGLAWQTGERTTFSLDGRYYRVQFEDPAYVDSQSLRGSADLSRRLGPRAALALVYSFEQTDDRVKRDTHYGSLRYTTTIGRASGLLLEGGISYTADATSLELPDPWNYFGGVSFNHALGRSSLAVFYRYEVLPAFGLGGVRAGNRVGLNATLPFGRAAELGLRASYFDEASTGAFQAERSTEAGATLGFHLASFLRLSFEGDYRRRRTTTATSPSDVDDVRAGAFLSIVPRSRGQEPVRTSFR